MDLLTFEGASQFVKRFYQMPQENFYCLHWSKVMDENIVFCSLDCAEGACLAAAEADITGN